MNSVAIKMPARTQKLLSVILGALLGGLMWRFRGTHGYGGSWGLIAVGTALTLLIFAFYGSTIKSRNGFVLLPVFAISAGLTVTGWGASNGLLSGYIYSVAEFPGEGEKVLLFSQPRALVIMMLMGFGLSCLFGLFAGSLFSGRNYKLCDYFILIAVFFFFSYLAKATFSHLFIKAVSPQIVDLFKDGLNAAGKTGSPWKVYMSHFDKIPWGKKIPFGRAYFEIIEHISHAFAAIALIIFDIVVFKDRKTALFSLFFNISTAFAITAADFFNVAGTGRGIIEKIPKLTPFTQNNWSMWEFCTGFLIGLFLMLIIALMSGKEQTEKEEYGAKSKKMRFAGAFTAGVYLFALVPLRAFVMRITGYLENKGVIESESPYDIIGIAVLTVIAAVFVFIKLKKNIFTKEQSAPVDCSLSVFSHRALTAYILTAGIFFIFMPGGVLYELPAGEGFFTALFTPEHIVPAIVICAFVLWCLLWGVRAKKAEK
ncbi:MAG: hypothetical protein IK085_08080 [Clostridia bacterium]|nr:hypothetical protein [Clostridia bacterium]